MASLMLLAALIGVDGMGQAMPPSTRPAVAAQEPQQEIVVLAGQQRGTIPGVILAQTSLDASAVAALGASNLADILTQIAPLTGGSQGRAGDGPVLLVNGGRIASFDEVKNLPPEAIERVDVLPEEAALRMGYPARSKPVNIVLKRQYAGTTSEVEGRSTTRGRRLDGNAEINLVRIAGDNRMTLDVQYQNAEPITESWRGVVRPVDALAASRAGVVAPANGGYFAIPAIGRSLADFAATVPRDDTGAYHDLVPASQQLTANGAFARTLGGGRSLSVNAKADRLTTHEDLGPTIADYTIAAAQAAPFATALRVRRLMPDYAPQRRLTRTDTLHLGGQVSGVGPWRWSFAGNLDRVSMARTGLGGIDASAWQAALAGGSMADVFGPPSAAMLLGKATTQTRSRDDTASADGFLSGAIARLPAGAVNLTLGAALGHEALDSSDQAGGRRMTRDHLGGQASLDLPLLAGSSLGALGAGVNASGDRWSDAGSALGYGANLSWRPVKTVSLLLSTARDGAPPTMQQLAAPLDVTPETAIYDYATGRSYTVARTSGGNPALGLDSRALTKLELTVKAIKDWSLTGTYTRISDANVLFAFGGATPAFAAAFPQRLTRDASDGLLAVDARPFTAAREQRQELRLAAVFNRNFGKASGPRVPGGGGFGGGHSFGASGQMIQFSLIDTIRLEDRLTLVSGGPVVDLVGGDAMGDSLRVARHRVEAQLSGTRNGIGLRANATWISGGEAGAGSAGALHFADRLAFNFRLFWFPGRDPALANAAPWLKGVRLLLAVDNAFDSYQRVANAAGQTPLAYQRGIVDPIGRTLRLSIRKTID